MNPAMLDNAQWDLYKPNQAARLFPYNKSVQL